MQGSFEEYVTSRGGALLRFAFVLSGDRHLAEDLVQEVLTRVGQQVGVQPFSLQRPPRMYATTPS